MLFTKLKETAGKTLQIHSFQVWFILIYYDLQTNVTHKASEQNTVKWDTLYLWFTVNYSDTDMPTQWLKVCCFSRVRLKTIHNCNFPPHSVDLFVH